MPIRPFSREQTFLFPPTLGELGPADHPARYVAAFVDGLGRAGWLELGVAPDGAARGAPGYAPAALLGAWLYGFMTGVRSSRKLEAACRDRVPYLWLTGWQRPDHTTLWRFYRAHRAGMRVLLKRTVRVAVASGLVDLAVQAVDGTRVAGSAARERTPDAEGLAALLGRVHTAIADLEAQNTGGDDPPPARLPAALARPAGGPAAGGGGTGPGHGRGRAGAGERGRPGCDAAEAPRRRVPGRLRPAGDAGSGAPARARRPGQAADHGGRRDDRPRRPRPVGADAGAGGGGDRGTDPGGARGWWVPLGRQPGGVRGAGPGDRDAGPAGATPRPAVPQGSLRLRSRDRHLHLPAGPAPDVPGARPPPGRRADGPPLPGVQGRLRYLPGPGGLHHRRRQGPVDHQRSRRGPAPPTPRVHDDRRRQDRLPAPQDPA